MRVLELGSEAVIPSFKSQEEMSTVESTSTCCADLHSLMFPIGLALCVTSMPARTARVCLVPRPQVHVDSLDFKETPTPPGQRISTKVSKRNLAAMASPPSRRSPIPRYALRLMAKPLLSRATAADTMQNLELYPDSQEQMIGDGPPEGALMQHDASRRAAGVAFGCQTGRGRGPDADIWLDPDWEPSPAAGIMS